MSEQKKVSLEEVVQGKLDADAEFQATLTDLSDEDKAPLIEAKRKEIREAEYATQTQIAADQKVRAEKAEKGDKPKPADAKAEGDEPKLSTTDFYALTNAKVPEEDIAEVQEYAQLKKISVADALKSPIVKGILKEKAEIRATADATQTRATRSTTKVDGNVVWENARKNGEDAIPAPGSKEATDMFFAKRGKKNPASA